MALGIAALRGKCTTSRRDVTVIGELALDGRVHPVRGAVAHARAVGACHILIPAPNVADVASTDAQVLSVLVLADAIYGQPEAHKQKPISLAISDVSDA